MQQSTVNEIATLGSEINSNQYRIVRLAARYDRERDWFRQGYATPSLVIAKALDIQTSTAREWVRVGHALDELPLINDAFATNNISYAKVRILTRSADAENESELLDLAHRHSANRLTIEIAKHLSRGENDEERDQRLHDERSVTVYTDANGMLIIRAALPPSIGKPVAEAINTLVQKVASTPVDAELTESEPPRRHSAPVADTAPRADASADAPPPHFVRKITTQRQPDASADASDRGDAHRPSLRQQLRELKRRWQQADDAPFIPTMAQQRADAFALLFLGTDVDITTEIILHVRGDGTTFDDGTPITNNAVAQQLDDAFVRLMIHDDNRKPLDATNKRRHPTTRQKRVVLETHNHQCVDCESTDLLELDHNPPYEHTRHTVSGELEPRCGPCHRARHRQEELLAA